MISVSVQGLKQYVSPGGGLSIFTDRDQQSTFLGSEFLKSVIFWVLVIGAVFYFGWLNVFCILKCFIFSRESFWVLFYSSSTSVSTLSFYHVNFLSMNHALRGYFLGFCFSEFFLVFCQQQSIFSVVQ